MNVLHARLSTQAHRIRIPLYTLYIISLSLSHTFSLSFLSLFLSLSHSPAFVLSFSLSLYHANSLVALTRARVDPVPLPQCWLRPFCRRYLFSSAPCLPALIYTLFIHILLAVHRTREYHLRILSRPSGIGSNEKTGVDEFWMLPWWKIHHRQSITTKMFKKTNPLRIWLCRGNMAASGRMLLLPERDRVGTI